MDTTGLLDAIQTIGRMSWDTRYPLDKEEAKVFHVLKYRLGAENAMSRAELAAATEFSDRWVRRIVEKLRKAHHLPIGSVASGGYYICIRPEEFTRNAEREYRRGKSCLGNLAVFTRNEKLREALGQLNLDLGGA